MNNKQGIALTSRVQKRLNIPHAAAALHIEPLLEMQNDLNGILNY